MLRLVFILVTALAMANPVPAGAAGPAEQAVSPDCAGLSASARQDFQESPLAYKCLRFELARRLGLDEDTISLSHVPGSTLIEVFQSSEAAITYVSADLKHVFVGSMLDMESHENLTQARIKDLNRIPFDQIPMDKVIRIVKGKGTLKFAVFEDPDCPFCRQMETKLEDFEDYTAYVLLLPLTDLHPQAERAATAIWCSEDPSAAWKSYVRNRVLPALRACETPIAVLRKLADAHHIKGTPTLVLPNGELLEGLPVLSVLKAKLNRMANSSAAK